MGQNVKITLGKKSARTFVVPNTDGIMEHSKGESLMFFGVAKSNNKNYRLCWGVGSVAKIEHGDKCDCVYMKFGLSKKFKQIIVIHNQARRQIMTLKRGQVATFYGMSKIWTFTYETPTGKHYSKRKVVLYAFGFQAWYTPRAVEIKKEWGDNEDIDTMETQTEEDLMNFLDQFGKTGDLES